MNENNENTPKIRFPGFTEPWERRKLCEYTELITKGTTPKDKAGDGEINFIKVENMIDGYITPVQKITKEEHEGYLKRSRLKNKDILFSIAGTLGRIAVIDERILPANTNQALAIIRGYKFDTNFLIASLNGHTVADYIRKNPTVGAQPNLSLKQVGNLIISTPSKGEQEKVGIFFAQLDNLITLRQRKLSDTRKLKAGLLQKMFPQKGASVPEVRFPGFTDPWEQRKAVEIAEYSKGNGYSKSDLTEAGVPIILYGRLYTKYQFSIDEVDTFAEPKSGAVYSQGNEVIVPASGETAEDIARASAVEKSGVLLGGDLNILRPLDFINPQFLALTISSGEPQKELAKKAQGKSVVHIHNSDIQEVSIAYPIRAEQDRIVGVFRNLDNLITLHQRKLEHLEEMKKSLLQQMFV